MGRQRGLGNFEGKGTGCIAVVRKRMLREEQEVRLLRCNGMDEDNMQKEGTSLGNEAFVNLFSPPQGSAIEVFMQSLDAKIIYF